ncbi:MAG: alpha/beta hydrolase [Propionibacteriaceae bacterium]|jgi:pimeloyl-ACP methyl ester carboxylesterase|nr:alpha/beta hydrolase [Propionibacteriaceae bacterium]
MPHIKINRANLFYQVLGPRSGPAIVMVHGLYTHHGIYFWCGAKDLANQGFRVILYDLRGHGFSTGDSHGFRLDRMSEDLIGLMDGLNIDQALLVGYSFGGTVVVNTAARYPQRVLGISILEASGLNPDPVLEAKDTDRAIQETLDGYSASLGMKLPLRSRNQFSDRVHDLIDAGLLDDLRADAGFFYRLDWSLVRCPAILIYGTSSPYSEDGRWVEAHMPTASCFWLDGDHNMVVRQGKDVAQRLEVFFRSVSGRSQEYPASEDVTEVMDGHH